MFITSDDYLNELNVLIENSDELDIAVAFWGEGSELLIPIRRDKTVRVIINLASGATNPKPIKQLMKSGVNIRQLDDLHAKVILGTQAAIVGSANFSANGLQLEDREVDGWSEAGLLTTSAPDLRAIKLWFNSEWDRSRIVTHTDLEVALGAWKMRRVNRPQFKRGNSIPELHSSEVKDRNLYVIIWGQEASEGAHAAYEGVVSQAVEKSLLEQPLLAKLSFYEGWPHLPHEGILISFQSHSNGRFSCDGVWRRIPELDVGPTETHEGLQIVVEQDSVLGIQVTGRQRKDLEKKLRPMLDGLWNEFQDENGGAVVSLEIVLERLKQ